MDDLCQPPPFTWIMWCKPKVARVVSLSVTPAPPCPCRAPHWPEGPSSQAGVSPAGTAEPLAREGAKRGCHRPGEHCQQPTPPPPLPIPFLLPSVPYPPSPTYRQTFFMLNVCVCVRASVLSTWASLDACVQKKSVFSHRCRWFQCVRGCMVIDIKHPEEKIIWIWRRRNENW